MTTIRQQRVAQPI